ncbi:MAG: alkaline phosphatase family protein [bacterium]
MSRAARALAVCLVWASCVPLARASSSLWIEAEPIEADGIDRFARLDDGVYRGASPSDAGLELLARAHVRTLLCLRSEVPYREKAEALGFRIVHIPIPLTDAPSADQIVRFLEIATDPASRPVFFHCRVGEDRTGAMAALYRMQVQGWPAESARAEMKRFGFSAYWRDLGQFVRRFGGAPGEGPPSTEGESRAVEHLRAADSAAAAGNPTEALEALRRALVRASDRRERVAIARRFVAVLAEASERHALPAGGIELAVREWAVLRGQDAEDGESLQRLAAIFREGLDLARAAAALTRARELGGEAVDTEAVGDQLARVRAVRGVAPRSDIGKRIGFLDRITRGELAALLVQELRVDRLRPEQVAPTYEAPRPALPPETPAALPDDARSSPYADDIGRALALGVRGLELLPDRAFHPDEPVSRAELAGVIADVLSRAGRDPTLLLRGLGEPPRFVDVDPNAWYRPAAELVASLGILASGDEAGGPAPRFRPRDAITGVEALAGFKTLRDRLDLRARAVVVVIDSLRAASLYGALDRGRLPRLARLAEERGFVRFEHCLAALPSDTIPNHTTIFTGALPGHHAITGNEWFDRALDAGEPLARRTREYLKFGPADDPGLGRAWSFPGFPLHELDLVAGVPTIYQALAAAEAERGRKVETAVAFDPVRRGTSEVASPGFLEALFGGRVLPFVEDDSKIDAEAVAQAVSWIESDQPPELLGVWLPGLDSWSHQHGPGEPGGERDGQSDYLARHVDALLGELADALERRGLLAETLLVVSADHGHHDVVADERHAITTQEVYRALAHAGFRVPLDSHGELDESERDVELVVAGGDNGGAALVSVQSEGRGWSGVPTLDEIGPVARVLANQPYVARVFALQPATAAIEARAFELREAPAGPPSAARVGWSALEPGRPDRLAERLAGLAGSTRSGDLFVEARKPYYFAVPGHLYRGEHGGADGEQDHVPLLLVNPPGHPRQRVATPVGNEDIAPTIGGVLGFAAALAADGRDLLDPPRIHVSSHVEGQVVPAGSVTLLGFAEDTLGVEQVEMRVDEQGPYVPVDGTATWEAERVLAPGRHTIDVRARDLTQLETTVRFHLVAR